MLIYLNASFHVCRLLREGIKQKQLHKKMTKPLSVTGKSDPDCSNSWIVVSAQTLILPTQPTAWGLLITLLVRLCSCHNPLGWAETAVLPQAWLVEHAVPFSLSSLTWFLQVDIAGNNSANTIYFPDFPTLRPDLPKAGTTANEMTF